MVILWLIPALLALLAAAYIGCGLLRMVVDRGRHPHGYDKRNRAPRLGR